MVIFCVNIHNKQQQQQQQQPFYGPLSGTTRVSRYQKKHSPTHHPDTSSNLYQLFPSTTIHSILLVQITNLAIFLHNLFSNPLWSTSWSGALHLIFNTFLHPISVFFLQHMPIPSQPVCCSFNIISSIPSLSLNSLLGTLSFTLTLHILVKYILFRG